MVQVQAAVLQAAPPVAVQLLVVAQPQVALVLQPVVLAQRQVLVVQPRRAALLLQVVRPQLVQVLPLRRVQRQLQLQPRLVWWQPVWLLLLWWLLQLLRRMMLYLPQLRIQPTPTPPTPIKFLTNFSGAPLGRFFIPVNLYFHF